MNKRLYLLSSFFVISLLTFIASPSPFYNLSSLFQTPRELIYQKVFAQNKNSDFQKLKEENLKLREQLVKLSEIKKDNAALRSQFEEAFIPSHKLLPAKVVGFKGNFNNPSTLIINQGKKSAVKKGMGVVVGRVLIGKIGKVTSYNSEVVLVVNKNFSTLGSSVSNKASGIVKGEEDFVIFEHVVITDNLSKNEEVVTSGEESLQGTGVQPGLIIGKIEKINKVESKPFQDAIIKSPLDARSLTTVFVLTGL